ncbi:hypothetical protein M413DRAFT_11287 [Hebeloma cylindrosporum]|uniref:F-box domain-containing protein n=1 Tax=Hebeloma cylindrosporum TaxID=76867 RepID=A0A0C2XTV8_HEBCY|nr:hypothetical protein M413DRAFT_11287 [Hebeloma cylindrosporum h7]
MPTLSNLPTELLLLLFEHINADNILSVGLTCRYLNGVAIPIFLERMGMPDFEKLVVLRPGHAGYGGKLTGLTIHFGLTRIERLVCILDNFRGSLTRNMGRIHHLISRLSSVGAVSLVFPSVGDKWTLRSDVVGKFFASFVEFFELLVLKSCTSIQVLHSHPLNIEASYNFQPAARGKHSPLRRFSRLLTHRSSPDPTAGGNYRQLVKHSHIPIPSANAYRHLRVFDLRMDFLLAPPLLEWTLAVMKHAPITSLALSAIEQKRQTEFREYLFPQVVRSLPVLQEIKLHFDGDEFLPIIFANLPLFPQLKKITLAMGSTVNSPLAVKSTASLHFPQLTTFNASLDQTVYFFNHNITCPALVSIRIVHTLRSNSEPLGERLSTLTNRLSLLHLSPIVSLCLDHIHGRLELPELGESGPLPICTTSARIISRLTLAQRTFPKNQQGLASQIENVIAWLSLFRGVKRLTVVDRRQVIDPPASDERRQTAIRAAITAVYPDIEFMNLVHLQYKYHYHWSSAKHNLERAVDGVPNIYQLRSKATDYFPRGELGHRQVCGSHTSVFRHLKSLGTTMDYTVGTRFGTPNESKGKYSDLLQALSGLRRLRFAPGQFHCKEENASLAGWVQIALPLR